MPTTIRKLAAIMFTDIVGYTALMGSDEDRAFETLRKNREIHSKLIEQFNGTLIKEMGDGMLISFDLASEAVLCAIEIQKECKSNDIPLKIGIHEGEMIFEGRDVLGDGVNIASRIQDSTGSGCIMISESVYRDIRNRVGIRSVFIEEKKFKNVEDPLKIYRVLGEDEQLNQEIPSEPKRPKEIRYLQKGFENKTFLKILSFMTLFSILLAGGWWINNSLNSIKSKKPLLVILSFDNHIGSDTMDYFVDGMHSSLINDISKIGSIRVLPKTSSMKYKNSGKSIAEIASELKADAIIEGEILCVADSVCSQLRMYDADKEETLMWSQDYKEDMSQILNWNNRVTKEISKKINVVLTPHEEVLLAKSRTVNPIAYEAYLKGLSHYRKLTKYDLEKATNFYELARDIDPKFTLAYVGIATVWIAQMQMGYLPYKESDLKLEGAINKALELDSTIAEIHRLLASYKCNRLWDWEGAGIEYKKALELDTNDALTHNTYSHYLAMIGQPEEGLKHGQMSIKIDPLNTFYKSLYGMALKNARHYNEAKELLEKILEDEPEQRIAMPSLWAVYHEKHMYPKAIDMAKRIYKARGDTVAVHTVERGYQEGGYKVAMQRTAEKMIARRDTTFVTPWQISTLYTRAGMKKEALDWLEKTYDEHSSNMVYINVDPLFDILRNEDRFKRLIRLMNFPQ